MDKFNLKTLEESRLPEAVVSSAKGVSLTTAYDNMIQERNIYSRRGFPKLPHELEVRRTG